MAAGTCVFTIASRNYMHAVRTLMEGVAQFAPSVHRVVALCDERGEFDFSQDDFEILELAQLPLPDKSHFVFQYTILELNTAIKPFVIAQLFERGFNNVIYFDPDIAIHDRLEDMIGRLDRANILLTPHITAPLTDDGHPDERQLMVCGTFNLGFVAMRRCDATEQFVRWWQRKLERDCVVDLKRGLFTDQKWMDFAPSLCDRVEVVRHPGWNVAYWNLPTRNITQDGDRFTVNGAPLVFFHYSGFDPACDEFSRHQDRYTISTVPPSVAALARDYAAQLARNGYPETKRQSYAHTAFADGTPIPGVARKVYREHHATLVKEFPDPADADAVAFIRYLNEPFMRNGRSSPLISRVMWEVLNDHPDLLLNEHFPDVFGAHADGFANWFVGAGRDIHKLPEIFVQPALDAMKCKDAHTAGEATFSMRLYQAAWRLRHLAAFVPFGTRQRIAGALFRRAYVDNEVASRRSVASIRSSPYQNGLNVVGHLSAEVGLGEAARSTLRACAAARIPAAAIDFTFEVESRREEVIPAGFAGEPEFNITLVHMNAEQMQQVVAVAPAVLRDRYTIGFWNWELPDLPDSWLDAEALLDEVWAPTHFCHVAFSRKLRIPVVHVPYAIEVKVPSGIGRDELGLPADDFTFLQVFDCLSVPERKNPMAVVEAYQSAKRSFKRSTRIVIKLINGERETELRNSLRSAVDHDDSIIVIDRYLHRLELNALFNSVDAYVSLHRAEGFGLTLAESMYLGKPVIATGWSGNMDFMTPWNSIPVPYKLVQIERDHGPYPAGQWWADPDVDAAAAAMVRLANEPEYARELGEKAANDMRTNNSPAAVGRIIQSRLDAISR